MRPETTLIRTLPTRRLSDPRLKQSVPLRRQSGNIPSPVRNVGCKADYASSLPSQPCGLTSEPISRARRLHDYAHAHHVKPTRAEARLWAALQAHSQIFHREVVRGDYIVDFLCKKAGLIIEVDGDSHLGKERYDATRHDWLTSQGYTVLYFTNRQVLTALPDVLKVINVTLAAQFSRRNCRRLAMARRMQR